VWTRDLAADTGSSVVVSLAGGLLVMTGALLPWLSLFAGLQRYSGMVGWYGRAIFTSGAFVVGSVLALRRRPPSWLPGMIAAVGLVLVAFSVWLLLGLHQIIHRASPMLVPRPGSGLFVVLAGAGLLSAAPAVSTRWIRRALAATLSLALGVVVSACQGDNEPAAPDSPGPALAEGPLSPALVAQGRDIFRFETYGDETFWTDTLRLTELRITSCSRRVSVQNVSSP